jgi:xanthine dehydrogenase accessory factor
VHAFFDQLRDHLARGPVALATVVASNGSTPRIAGARQLLTSDGTVIGTVGGGVMESRVIESARLTVADGRFRSLQADLFGNPHDLQNGVCGGRMTVWLVRLVGAEALRVVEEIGRSLLLGKRVRLSTSATGDPGLELLDHAAATGLHETRFVEVLAPAPRLLIVGAGHIGRALARQMIELRFVPTVHDDRREMMTHDLPGEGWELESGFESCVHKLLAWEGPRYAALVTRGFMRDVDALRRLADGGAVEWLDYLGILGSKRRLATVLAEYRELGLPPLPNHVLHAPIGIEIGAETPEEIAVSIAAEMIRDLRCKNGTRGS